VTGRALAFLVLALAVQAVGCDRSDESQERDGRTPAALLDGGVAVIGLAGAPTTPLAPFAATALDTELAGVLFLALNYGEWGDDGMTYEEGHSLGLARSWEIDGQRLTYHLDPERRWSDGTPVTSEDVVFTYELLHDPVLALPLSFATARMDSVVAVDDTTVTFHFQRQYGGMIFDTGVGILPAHVYGDASADGIAAIPLPRGEPDPPLVTSGPFTVVEWRTSERVVLARNEAAPVPPRLDRLVLVVLPDETTRLASLRTGELDMAQVSSFRQAARLREQGLRVLSQPQRGYDYIAWNPGHPAFGDVRVRRALSLAIDRDELIAALDMTGFAEKAYGPYGSLFGGLAPEPPDGRYGDPGEAGRLLNEAGWTDSDGDGVRERGDTELRFELLTTSANERRETAVQLIQSQLAQVGAWADIRLQELGSLFQLAQRREYEAFMLGWQVSLDPDISIYWQDPESPLNVVGYNNPLAAARMDSALAQPSSEAAARHWKAAAATVAADYPYAFLWFFDLLVAVGPRLQGVQVDPVGFLRTVHEWGVLAAE
jgi:peptide/nickel transport system substrate-binding protein